ncbi:MAG: hypothetical protein UV28_C0008G0015 [Candidatus Collierbacteria bacterium GW2011_GWE2_42_48]|nr:MAG: hypothetical protein UV28_C0008G0015 [Candidatus Collierbacteria bacterium GW2011_GWE2_42_48]
MATKPKPAENRIELETLAEIALTELLKMHKMENKNEYKKQLYKNTK